MDYKWPIFMRNQVISRISESFFDLIPISELQIDYIEDLDSLNNAATIDNNYLESLSINYNYEIQNEKTILNQLNFDKFKNLKKLHLINENVESSSPGKINKKLEEQMMLNDFKSENIESVIYTTENSALNNVYYRALKFPKNYH